MLTGKMMMEMLTLSDTDSLLIKMLNEDDPVRFKALFDAWHKLIDFDAHNGWHINGAFVFLYDKARRMGVSPDAAIAPRVAGLKRYLFCSNTDAMTKLLPVMDDLRENGVDVMFIKGMAMLAGGYINFSHRFMDDADLYVPPKQVKRAVGILEKHGWKKDVLALPDIGFSKRGVKGIDLHKKAHKFWHADGIVRRDAESVTAPAGRGCRVYIPCAEDMLLIVLSDACDEIANRRAFSKQVMWFLEVWSILTKSTAFDWDKFVKKTRQMGYSGFVRPMMAVYRDLAGDARVPENLLPETEDSRKERRLSKILVKRSVDKENWMAAGGSPHQLSLRGWLWVAVVRWSPLECGAAYPFAFVKSAVMFVYYAERSHGLKGACAKLIEILFKKQHSKDGVVDEHSR